MSAVLEPIVVAAAAIEQAKAYLRIDDAVEDAQIARLIAAAIGLGEGFTGQVLLARGAEELLPAGTAWRRLAAAPVQAILAVDGLPAEGAAFALAVDAYAIDIDARGEAWVRATRPGAAGRLRVRFRAGIAADWALLPEALRLGVLRATAHLHAHRDAADGAGLPAAITALWRPWKRMRLA